ncbi:MAG: zinc ribbon domain-containing protein [Oscillospiraceae bacterium]|nr:zinc ribbon domain-containing protein [Oscillospiraceae bacterium]
MYCIKCGHQLPDDAVFCQKCGAKQSVSLDKTPSTDPADSPIRVSSVSYDETEKQELM